MLKAMTFIFLFFMLVTCKKQIEIDLPDHKPELVINSLFTTDSLIKVYISMSAPIKEMLSGKTEIKEVSFYENNAKIEPTIKKTDSLLTIFYTPNPENNYSIEILTNNGHRVFASDVIPHKSQLDVTDFKPNIGFDSEGYEYSEITIEINDNNTKADYYELSAVTYINSGHLVKNYIWSNDVIITNEGDADFYYYNLLFCDKLFNGQKIALKCFTWYDIYDKEVYIYLRSVSENYYKYKKSLMRHFANQEGDVWSGTGNPVDLYSNIEGGYGIFAGYQEDIDTIYVTK